jgi:hypothetical protein
VRLSAHGIDLQLAIVSSFSLSLPLLAEDWKGSSMSVTRRCIAQHISRAKKVKIAIKPIYAKKKIAVEKSV